MLDTARSPSPSAMPIQDEDHCRHAIMSGTAPQPAMSAPAVAVPQPPRSLPITAPAQRPLMPVPGAPGAVPVNPPTTTAQLQVRIARPRHLALCTCQRTAHKKLRRQVPGCLAHSAGFHHDPASQLADVSSLLLRCVSLPKILGDACRRANAGPGRASVQGGVDGPGAA